MSYPKPEPKLQPLTGGPVKQGKVPVRKKGVNQAGENLRPADGGKVSTKLHLPE